MLRCRRSKRRAVKAERSSPAGEALTARSRAGTQSTRNPARGSYLPCRPGVARTPGVIIESEGAAFLVGDVDQVFSQQSRHEAGGQSEGLGAGHSSVARGHMLRSGRSRLGSSTSSARHGGSHADNELAAGHDDGAQFASARQRISPSRRP
jgi:hypothetical protein